MKKCHYCSMSEDHYTPNEEQIRLLKAFEKAAMDRIKDNMAQKNMDLQAAIEDLEARVETLQNEKGELVLRLEVLEQQMEEKDRRYKERIEADQERIGDLEEEAKKERRKRKAIRAEYIRLKEAKEAESTSALRCQIKLQEQIRDQNIIITNDRKVLAGMVDGLLSAVNERECRLAEFQSKHGIRLHHLDRSERPDQTRSSGNEATKATENNTEGAPAPDEAPASPLNHVLAEQVRRIEAHDQQEHPDPPAPQEESEPVHEEEEDVIEVPAPPRPSQVPRTHTKLSREEIEETRRRPPTRFAHFGVRYKEPEEEEEEEDD